MGRKYTFEEVKEKFAEKGFILLEDSYESSHCYMSYMNKDGYKFYSPAISILSNNNNSRNKGLFITNRNNIYSLDNIKLWLKLKNKNFELVDNQEFVSATAPLLWKCLDPKCGEIFDMPWCVVYNGNNCPFCEGRRVGASNCLANLAPELVEEWDNDVNAKTPYDYTAHSGEKVAWVCKKDHSHKWVASVANRFDGSGCPQCAHQKLSPENSLATKFPEISKEWDSDKNYPLTPSDIMAGTSKKFWWKCSKGHEWRSAVSSRTTNDAGCPECDCLSRDTKYSIDDIREILKEQGFTLISEEYRIVDDHLFYKDKDGYVFYSETRNIISHNINGAKLTHPNNPYSIYNINLWLKLHGVTDFKLADTIFINASTPMRWQCLRENCGEYFYTCWESIMSGHGCSFCASKKVGSHNSLEAIRHDLTEEWDFVKNYPLTPGDVTAGTHRKVWWKCKDCGHEWRSEVKSRAKQNTDCPGCNESHGEKNIAKFLDRNNIEYVRQYRFADCKNIFELPYDFYLPRCNTLIEYDGEQHYKITRFYGLGIESSKKNLKNTQRNDAIKTKYAEDNDIPFIRIPYWKFEEIDKILNDHFFPNII